MTWVKLSDTFAIEPRWDALSVHAFACHVAAMCDCAQKLTDGRLTTKAVRRLPIVDDPEAAAVELVAAGLWQKTDDGYLIVDYLKDQELAADVEDRIQSKRRYDQEFQRDRRKASPQGLRVDEYRAKQAAAAGMSVGDWLAVQRGDVVRPSHDVVAPVPTSPLPSRPVPTRPGGTGEGRRGGASGAAGSALTGSPGPGAPREPGHDPNCHYQGAEPDTCPCRLPVTVMVDSIPMSVTVADYEDDDENVRVEVGPTHEWLAAATPSMLQRSVELLSLAFPRTEAVGLERPECQSGMEMGDDDDGGWISIFTTRLWQSYWARQLQTSLAKAAMVRPATVEDG